MSRLSDSKIKGLKATEKRQDIHDGDGLYLRISPSGTKTFYYRFRQAGKLHTQRIGKYPLLSLKDARAERDRMAKNRETGKSINAAAVSTVNDLAQGYLEGYSKLNNTHRAYKDHQRMLENDVLPIIGAMKPDEVMRHHVKDCLRRFVLEKKPSAHNHTLNVVRKMFNWGIEEGFCENNPAYMIKSLATTPRNRVLTDDEIRTIWQAGNSDSAKILKFMLTTGQRVEECQFIDREQVNGDWWTCVQKKGSVTSEKRVYLTRTAADMLGDGKGRAFPSQNQQAGLSKYAKRKFKTPGWVPKDIRRTVATHLSRLGYSEESIQRFLGHSRGKLRQTYIQHQYDDEKRAMALAWEQKLLEIVS